MKATHKVQSHRGLIERMFAALKKWQILQGGSVDFPETLEKELDVALALHNINLLDKAERMELIPGRAKYAPDAHIITRDLEPSLKIPKPMTLDNAKFPAHWKTFKSAMTSILPELGRILKREGEGAKENPFSKRKSKRGHNLFSGGYVSSLQCEALPNDVWRLKASVHASMKQATYECYFEMQKGDVLIRQACMCKSG